MWKVLNSWTYSVEPFVSFNYAHWSSANNWKWAAKWLVQNFTQVIDYNIWKLFIIQKGINNVQYDSQERLM